MKKTQFGLVPTVIIVTLLSVFYLVVPSVEGMYCIIPFLVVLWLLFYSLTIEVSETQVKWSFGIGIIRGSYLLSEIQSVRKQTYFPLGYGIRFRPGVRLYNVSGTKAIALTFKNTSTEVWLGTDVPDEWTNYIGKQIHHAIN